MTKVQAITRLKKTRQLSTGMLKPFGISFESFLRFAQLSDERCEQLIDQLIAKLEEPCPSS